MQLPGMVRDENYTVEMQGLECPNCGYKTIEGTAMPEYGRLLSDKYRAAHGLLTSSEIRNSRARLGMSQATFAQYIGVGPASIKRWEMGKIQDQRNDATIRRKSAADPHEQFVWSCAWTTSTLTVTSTSEDWILIPVEKTESRFAGVDLWSQGEQQTVPPHLATMLLRP